MRSFIEPGITARRQPLVRPYTVLVIATLISLTGVAHAQTSGRAGNQQSANSESQITLNLQDVDIRVLINTVAEVSGKNFVVDPRVKGKVSVISGATLSPEELYDVFLSILEVHNFATVDSGSVIKILPSNVIKQRPTPTIFSPSDEDNDAQLTQIVQIKHAAVQELVPIIRPLIPPTSHFAPHVPSNSIVLTDTAANIQRILKIIKSIDVPDKRSNVRVVYLEKAKASDLANTLTQLVNNSSAVGEQKAQAGATKVSIQPLDAINALVIAAPDDEYAKIQAIIDELDIERSLASDVNVIYLKHAKAEDLVTILNDVTKTNTEGAVSEFSVQADEATNSLIVKASGNQLKTVESVVDKLDIRRAQVFVETIIAEVALDQDADLGVRWGLGDNDNPLTLVDRDNPSQVLGSATASTNFNVANNTGFSYSLLDFKKYKLDVIVNALRSDTNSNILSTPTILTLDNEEAEIVVGQEVPFVTGRFEQGTSISTNNDNNTDGDGNTTNNNISSNRDIFQTIERKDVGLKLKIKPQISEGDTIQLEVTQEISDVATTTVQGQSDLITNRRSIEAVVQVDDGQVVVLGGLIQDDVVDTVEWVPVLGKIPLIGALFRRNEKEAVKRNLMVFLKPRIIRSPKDLEDFSRVKYDEIRRDGKLAKENSSSLIEDADPPVLDEYDKVLNDGAVTSERRKQLSEHPHPHKKKRKNWFFTKSKRVEADAEKTRSIEGDQQVGIGTDGDADTDTTESEH